MSKMMNQVTLVNVKTGAALTTWIEARTDIQRDTIVTLKNVEGEWRVRSLYKPTQPFEVIESNRGWDNNNYEKHVPLEIKKK